MVDVSGPALETAEANLRRNRHLAEVAACRVTSTRGDAFEVLEGMVADGRAFDLVVLDPPSFARAANQVDRAVAAYERLAALGIALTCSGGTMVQASCSARIDVDTLAGAVSRAAGAAANGCARSGAPVTPSTTRSAFATGPTSRRCTSRWSTQARRTDGSAVRSARGEHSRSPDRTRPGRIWRRTPRCTRRTHAPEVLTCVAIEADVMPEVVALEDAVVLDHPVIGW